MISKSNKNLQITLNKKAYKELLQINEFLNNQDNFCYTKSQIIEKLIYKYASQQEQSIKYNEYTIKKDLKMNDVSSAIKELKNSLMMSYAQLSEYTGIFEGTLKKYANKQREPNAENLQKLIKIFKENHIKY